MKFDVKNTVVDFIAKTDDPNVWRMVLVEQGPWLDGDVDNELYQIQNRLYDCVDAALDGDLARKFPETLGSKILIQFDAYDIESKRFEDFFESFSSQILKIPDYANSLKENKHIEGLEFKLNILST